MTESGRKDLNQTKASPFEFDKKALQIMILKTPMNTILKDFFKCSVGSVSPENDSGSFNTIGKC